MFKNTFNLILIHIVISSLSLFAQKMTNTLMHDGEKVFVHDEKNIYSVNGKNYISIFGKTYQIHTKEINVTGPISLDHYIQISKDSIYSLTEAYSKKTLGDKKSKLYKHKTITRVYPDSKPFIRYKSPRTGKKYKFYDIKRTPDGRIISEDEFQSYRGNYVFIKRIKGGNFAMDTTIIKPPNAEMIRKKKKSSRGF